MITLAYRPLIDPLNVHATWWLLLLPLALLVAIAYKAVRAERFDGYWRDVAVMTGQIVLGMIALGAAFYVVVEWLAPRLAPMPGM